MNEILEVVIDLERLREKSANFFAEEQARRERALLFVEKVCEIVLPVANMLFTGDVRRESYLKTTAVGKSDTYFRWEKFHLGSGFEEPGFYHIHSSSGRAWGAPIKSVDGTKFWGMVRAIVDWLPEVERLMSEKDESRERLLALLNQNQKD